MAYFPDESTMPRSEDGSEPIRGGSVGLNRILGKFVSDSAVDRRPQFHAYLISACTIFRNVWNTKKELTEQELELGFVTDLNLFLEYLDIYLSNVANQMMHGKFCPVVVYFPKYTHIPKDILRDQPEKAAAFWKAYNRFASKHGHDEGEVKKLEFVRCLWVSAGSTTYPHKDAIRKFRESANHAASIYAAGDKLCLISHIPLDYYMGNRVRNIHILESHTARVRPIADAKLKLDKEGRVPFQPAVHIALGDGVLVKALASNKQKKLLLETAEKERWNSRSEEDVRMKISKIVEVPTSKLRQYDFV